MFTALFSHIKKFVDLSVEDEKILSDTLKLITVKKKDFLLEEGQICRAHYFMVKGCARLYFIDVKGAEQTVQFAIENWWLTDYTSFNTQVASHFFIQVAEDSEIIAIEEHQQEELFSKIPQLERYFRKVYQKANAAAQFRMKYFFGMSAEERYHNFNNSFPSFVQRIPQYMLASFLGFTPEFLSKIRAKK